jgi:hypothetical protein
VATSRPRVHFVSEQGCETPAIFDANSFGQSGDIVFSFIRSELDPTQPTGSRQEIHRHTFAPSSADATVFASRFFELYAPDASATFGVYNASGPGARLLAMDWSSGALEEIAMQQLHDAVWLDRQTLLVAGTDPGGLSDGRGVYAVDLSGATPALSLVVIDPGASRLDVLRTRDGHLLVHTAPDLGDPSLETYLVGLPRVRNILSGAASVLDTTVDSPARVEIGIEPRLLGGRWVATESNASGTGDIVLQRVRLDASGGLVYEAPSPVIVDRGVFQEVVAVDDRRLLLDHRFGVLVVESTD